MARIPVASLDENGTPSSSPFKVAPCISIRYSFEKPILKEDGVYTISGLNRVWALIDTGADYNMLDDNLLQNNIYPIQNVVTHGVNGASTSLNYEITLHPDGSSHFHRTGVLSMPHRPDRPWRMILGRKFLQCTKFTYDADKGIQSLEFFNNPNAK